MTGRGPTLLLFLLPALLLLPLRASGSEPKVNLLASTLRPYADEEVTLTLEVSYAGRLPARPIVQWPVLDQFVAGEMSAELPRRNSDRGVLVESARRAVRPLSAGKITLRGGGILLGERLIPAPSLTLRVRPLPPAQPGDLADVLESGTLDVFDPATGTYRRLETASAESQSGGWGFATLILPGILLLAWALRRRRACSLDGCLAAILKRSPEGLSRRQILEGLSAAGLSPDDLSALVRFWSATDRSRFTPGACPPADDTGEQVDQIASRLRKAVDKKVRIS